VPASLLVSERRLITAVTAADQEHLDQLCFVFLRKLVASFQFNKSQTRNAHDLVRLELVMLY